MITNDDYTFMENAMSENWSIRILTGTWADVIYTYGKIGIKESSDKEEATLQFNYAIVDSGDYESDDLVKSEEFNNHVGDILSHILTDALENDKFTTGKDDRADTTHSS